MQVDVLNIEGKKTGRTLELPDEIFGAEPNEHVVYLAVKQFLGAQRQGTHKVTWSQCRVLVGLICAESFQLLTLSQL